MEQDACYILEPPPHSIFIVQSLSPAQLCHPIDCSTPGSSVLHCLPEFAQFKSIELMMLSNHPILCCPFPFAFNLSQHQGLSQRTVWRIWHWKMSPAGWKVSSMLVGKTRAQLLISPEKWSDRAKVETILSISLNKRRRYFLPRGKRGRLRKLLCLSNNH